MSPTQLSDELRQHQTPDLARRRAIVGLSLLGVGAAKLVSLYQMGLIRKLPDRPFWIFDSNKVNASSYAYKRLQTPDGFLMLLSYATTATLAAAGGKNRGRDSKILSFLMAGKIAADCLTNFKLTREEWKENEKLCVWCQMASLASLASLLLAWPEFKHALQREDD